MIANGIACRAAVAALLCISIGGVSRAAEGEVDAMIPVEVLAVDAALADGEIWVGGVRWTNPRVALQPARAARAVVVEGARTRAYVLALLHEIERKPDGALDLDVPADRLAWCRVAAGGITATFCYQDTDGDGMFDVERIGLLANAEPLSLSRVGGAHPTERTAYREARPDERPLFDVGYVSCGSPLTGPVSESSELRYSTIVRRGDAGAFAPAASTVCNGVAKIVETRADGDATAEFGRFTVLLHGDGERVTTSLLEGIAAGTMLGDVRSDRPLVDAVDVNEQRSHSAPDAPVLYFTAAPDVASGVVQAGATVLSASVAHGITGTLKSDMTAGFTKSVVVAAGSPLFGAVMSSRTRPGGGSIVWCAPQPAGAKAASLCFAPGPGGYTLIENGFRYAVSSVVSSPKGVLPPVVERGPVDFGGPLVLLIRFDSADSKNTRLSWSVAQADAPAWSELWLRRANDGSSLLVLAGLMVEVTPSKDAKSAMVETAGAWLPAEDAMPVDGVMLLRRR